MWSLLDIRDAEAGRLAWVRRRAAVLKERIAVLWGLSRGAGRRLSWGVADQAVSSLTNFAIVIFIAHSLGAVQFGAFSLAYVTYWFVLSASRGLATDPLLVRFSATNPPVWREAVASCTGTATLVGCVRWHLRACATCYWAERSRVPSRSRADTTGTNVAGQLAIRVLCDRAWQAGFLNDRSGP